MASPHRLRLAMAELVSSIRSDRTGAAALMLLVFLAGIGPMLYGVPSDPMRPAVGGGAVAPLGNTLVCVLAFLIAALTFLSNSSPSPRSLPRVPLAAAAALALLGVVQLLPLPDGVIGAVSPRNLRIHHDTTEIRGLFGAPSGHPRVSIAPGETLSTLLLLLAYISIFTATAGLLRTRGRRRLVTAVLVASALVQILWAVARQPVGRLRGFFVNPDHFAGYLEIGLGLAFGILWAEILTSRDRVIDVEDRSERFERRFPPIAIRVVLWGLIAAGIALTESRGGILAAAVTTLVLLAAALRRRSRHRGRVAVLAAAVLIGTTLAVALAGSRGLSRFLLTDPRDLGSTTRVAIWKTSFDAWREFPVLGSGLGTFREAFRLVQPPDLSRLVEQAHDDFLQLAVTGGLVGVVLGVALFASLLGSLWRAARRQRHREESALALGGFGALLSLALHGLVEFNLSIPIISATLACALGGAWAACQRT